MKKKEKKLTLDSAERKVLIQEDKQLLLESLIQGADALTLEEFNAKIEADEKIKHELIGGTSISIKDIKGLISSKKKPYEPHFGYEKPYFKNMYKLKGWPEEKHRDYVKDDEVPGINNRLIYGRFDPEVFKHLKKENPFIFAYIRKYKYFQFLSEEGQRLLDGYIYDAYSMMEEYSDWDKFEYDYCVKYNLTYQRTLSI